MQKAGTTNPAQAINANKNSQSYDQSIPTYL